MHTEYTEVQKGEWGFKRGSILQKGTLKCANSKIDKNERKS